MNPRNGAKGANSSGNFPAKGKGPESSGSGRNNASINQLSQGMAAVDVNSAGGGWEVFTKKSRNRGGANALNAWGTSNSAPKSWGQQEMQKTKSAVNNFAGKTPGKPGNKVNPKMQASNWEAAYMAPPPPAADIPPPLQDGWQWPAKNASSLSPMQTIGNGRDRNASEYSSPEEQAGTDEPEKDSATNQPVDISDDDQDDFMGSDDDFSDEFDSDVSEKSHETKKKGNWYRAFFEALENLSNEQINEPTRQWHCPACKDGPGAIDWYRGLQPLMTHAKTKGSKRVKLHRTFAELLEEELHRRGTSIVAPGEAFGKWKGLRETNTDREIIWPPMVVIMNTKLEQDEDDKWIGMGNQELLEYFRDYDAVKARHSYGPHGHRGMSVLIFEASAVGYTEAERLHKHFIQQGTDREAWDHRRVLYYPGGKRQLYGFLAQKEDLDYFNQHSHGKTRLKFEAKSYQEMVVSQMKQMSEDNQQLTRLKKEVFKQEQQKKTLEESVGVLAQKLQETEQENFIVRERTMMQHAQNTEEMDNLEEFFKQQIAKVHQDTKEKEKLFEKLLQEERSKAKKQSEAASGTKEERRLKKEEIMRFISTQVKEVEEFKIAREEIIRAHEDKKVEMKRRHLEEEVLLEKEFDEALTELMKKYAPESFPSCSNT